MSFVGFVASPSATRVWRVCKAAGHEFPVPEAAEGDEVLAYLIREAVFIKASKEDRKAEEEAYAAAEKKQWKDSPIGSGKPGEGPGRM